MNMKSIRFSPPAADEEIRALLDNRKTVTRRVVKEPYYIDDEGSSRVSGLAIHRGTNMTDGMPYPDSPYRSGDILYVRETFFEHRGHFYYKADGKHEALEKLGIRFKWRPSIHMPREAARIFLRVTNVRVERLQDPFFEHGSTIFHLQKEGISIGEHCRECIENYGSPCCIGSESECGILDEIRGYFSELWNGTVKPAHHAAYGWSANPWVWVIEFERISKSEASKSEML